MSTTSADPTGPTGHAMAPGRYTKVAVALHWLLAALILLQIAGGVVAHELPNDVGWKGDAFTLHKSFGLTILALALFRLGWRLAHPAPPLPDGVPGWQRVLARATQVGFYALMIGVPLVGWWMISGGERVSRLFFLVPIPDLPGGGLLGHEAWAEVHEVMAFAILGLLALHVAGALKHHFVDRDGVLARMVPGMSEPTAERG